MKTETKKTCYQDVIKQKEYLNSIALRMAKTLSLLHSEQPKRYRVLAILSAIGLIIDSKVTINEVEKSFISYIYMLSCMSSLP